MEKAAAAVKTVEVVVTNRKGSSSGKDCGSGRYQQKRQQQR
jgi:hypothetical protein